MADGTCGVSSGASARAYSSREESACVDDETRREIEARKADEARRHKDAEAEARASAHYANGSSCTSAASHDAGSCGAGAPTRRSIDLTNRAEVGQALTRLQTLDAAPSTSPDERAWLKAQEPALRSAQARFASNDHAVAARAVAEKHRAEADRKRIDALVHPNETFEKRVDYEASTSSPSPGVRSATASRMSSRKRVPPSKAAHGSSARLGSGSLVMGRTPLAHG